MTRRAPGRVTRQILSGAELTPPGETVGGHRIDGAPISITFGYFLGLSALVILSALVWAIWGAAAASPVVLVLAIGLIASWLVL